jgi:histidinol-phosphate aminotransferase
MPDTNLSPRPAVNRLVPYSPGKPIDETKREYGLTDVIKLGSNENALGPSPKAVEAMKAALTDLHLYPDGAAFTLKSALSAHTGLPPESITVGNGSDELIHYLGVAYLRPGDNILVGHPSFVRYESAAVLNDSECIKVPLKDMIHDLDAMAGAVNDRTRMVFIGNPNNPTGTINSKAELDRFLDRVPASVLVVLDEAYSEYVESADYPDATEYVRQGNNVIVLYTFSKIYGIAGLRVGYGLAKPEIIRAVEQVREPFNVNSLAQVGATAALSDKEHVERSLRSNAEGKRAFYAEFDLLGLPYAPSEANFVFVDVKRDCRPVYEALLRKGVIVRTGDIFGLPTWLRVTIGARDENRRFLSELAAILAK